MKLRPYIFDDKEACLSIFDSNMPQYFAEHEREEFATFLDEPECLYFVVEDEHQQILGCGGYDLDLENHTGAICWGMVTNTFHGQGVGRFLLKERLRRMCDALLENLQIYVHNQTSQHTAGFFEKFGFVTLQITKNAFAPGLHRYDMVLMLNAAKCDALTTQS